MILVSFIITTCSKRIENLKQCVRFLVKREPQMLKLSELIIVCQDRIDFDNSDFSSFRLLNLELPYYSKPIMHNRGVEAAQGEIIVMLDGDRILPYDWFHKQCRAIKQDENQVISAHRHHRLTMTANDEAIEDELVPRLADFRIANMAVVGDALGKKSVMSGNTVMKRDIYLDLGGQDESYIGYGCNDTDFAYKIFKAGIKIVLTSDDEYHLYHPVDMDLEEFNRQNFDNALKFCRKWNVQPSIHWKKLWQAYNS